MYHKIEPKFRKAYRIKKVSAYIIGFLFSFYFLKCLAIFLGKSYYERRLFLLWSVQGAKLKVLFSEIEGLFIKAGQFLSISGFFLPEVFKNQLEGLQDAATPKKYDEIEKSLADHFQVPLSSIFSRIEQKPLAVASIAQVHKAWLLDGSPVVLKIQHAHIEKIAAIDLEIIKRIILLIGKFFAIEGLDFVHRQIEDLILQEIDFEKEAKSLSSVSTFLADEPFWSFPKIYPSLSGKKVLVLSWIQGRKITDLDNFRLDSRDASAITTRLWHGFCKMIFENDIYHADPHPGNILLDNNGHICLLDFGAVSTLSPLFKREIPGLIIAFTSMDVQKLTRKLIKLGFVNDTPSAEFLSAQLANAFNQFLENDLDQLFNPQGALHSSFWKNPVSHILLHTSLKDFSSAFKIPKDYILLGRTFSLLLGISLILRPGENPLIYLNPIFKSYLKEKRYTQAWLKEAGILGKDIISLPTLIKETILQFQTGQSSLKTPDIWRSAQLLYLLGQQVTMLLITASLFIIALRDNKYPSDLSEIDFVFLIFGLISLILLVRKIRTGEKLMRK
jgi:ubiquinone biosynthesis protein